MEKKAKEKEEGKTRIYIGGLGEQVTNDDLIKIFSSQGKVTAVDIIRTKGRSFGYIDFSPSSEKSLPKLFSTYNGCAWKGGRLRLEKAKEHYLARLRREWEEDAELASCTASDCVDVDRDTASLEKPEKKKVLEKDMKLKIFFPGLRKVKALPFNGTGKHKYSFQRVEVPCVPMHFCDCEEHSVPFHSADGMRNHHHSAEEERTRDLEAQGGVINEEEINIMNSVMNKLFEWENISNASVHSTTRLPKDEHNCVKLVEDHQIGEKELDGVADEDNLVINVVSRGNNRMALSEYQEKATISSNNKKLSICETRTSKDKTDRNVPEEQKKNNLPPNKKRKSRHNEETIGNEFIDGNTKTMSGVKQSTASHSWAQKLSWKELVGNKESHVFSVSNILPANPPIKEADNDIEPFEQLEFGENESDEDNLIINVASKKKNTALPMSQQQEKISTMNQKSIFSGSKASKDRPIQQSIPSANNKKRQSVLDEESDKNKLVHATLQSDSNVQTHKNEMEVPSGGLVEDQGNDELSFANVMADNPAKEEQPVSDGPDVPVSTDGKNQDIATNENFEDKSSEKEIDGLIPETQPIKTSAAPDKSGRGSSWFQKSSWTQLVNDNNSSFRITQITPDIAFKKQEVSKSHIGMDISSPSDNKFSNLVREDKSEPIRGSSPAMGDGKEGDASRNIPEKNQLTVVGSNEGSTSTVENKYNLVQRQTTDRDITIGETCLFMRNAASMKEWAKAKAALSGSHSHKRKSIEK